MFRILCIAFVGGLLWSCAARSATVVSPITPPHRVSISHGGVVDIGAHYQSKRVPFEVTLTNDTDQTVQIESVAAVGPHDVVDWFPRKLDPGESGVVKLSIWSQLDYGVRIHGFRINVDGDSDEKPVMIQVKSFGMSVLDQYRPSMDFGVVRLGASVAPKTLPLSSHAVSDFRLTKVLEAPAFVTADIAADGQSLTVIPKPGKQWGPRTGYVQVGLSTPSQKAAWIKVDVNIQGQVVPDFPVVQMGLVRQGNQNGFVVPVRSADGKPFSINEPTIEGFKGGVQTGECVPVADGCKLLTINIASDQQTGRLNGEILLRFPEYEATLYIPVSALLISKETKVLDLDEPKPEDTGTGKSEAVTGPVDIGEALKKAVAPAKVKPPEPPGKGPVLRWQVGNQQTLYGYLIYRANAAEGPFVRVNDEIILVKDPQDTNYYAWRDTTAEPGKTYWYYVSTLATNGQKQQLSGAQKVVANEE